jgi:hypothetical protein
MEGVHCMWTTILIGPAPLAEESLVDITATCNPITQISP